MSHFTEGVLQAYLDEEVAADARTQVTAHVSGCADCAARLHELRDLNTSFADAIATLNPVPLSSVSLPDLRKRAEQEAWRDRWTSSRRYLGRAAILILSVAVAAVPGSPVRAWLAGTWNGLTKGEAPAPVVQEPAATPEPTPPPTGVAVIPLNGNVQVILESPAAGTVVRVVLIDSQNAIVEATGGAANARPRTSTGKVTLTGGGEGEIRISLPRAVDATIQVGGRPYLVKQGQELRFVGPVDSQRDETGVTFKTPK